MLSNTKQNIAYVLYAILRILSVNLKLNMIKLILILDSQVLLQ